MAGEHHYRLRHYMLLLISHSQCWNSYTTPLRRKENNFLHHLKAEMKARRMAQHLPVWKKSQLEAKSRWRRLSWSWARRRKLYCFHDNIKPRWERTYIKRITLLPGEWGWEKDSLRLSRWAFFYARSLCNISYELRWKYELNKVGNGSSDTGSEGKLMELGMIIYKWNISCILVLQRFQLSWHDSRREYDDGWEMRKAKKRGRRRRKWSFLPKNVLHNKKRSEVLFNFHPTKCWFYAAVICNIFCQFRYSRRSLFIYFSASCSSTSFTFQTNFRNKSTFVSFIEQTNKSLWRISSKRFAFCGL